MRELWRKDTRIGWILWVAGALLWSAPVAAEVPPPDAAFAGEPFRRLELEAHRRHPELAPEAAARLMRENFEHVYANCIRRGRFLVKPGRERIAARAVELIEWNERVAELLADARKLLALSEPGAEARRADLVREVGRTGKAMRDLFRGHFEELSPAAFQITWARERRAFLLFVLEAERIHRLMSSAIDRYFFRARPGVISVDDYERAPIPVLAEALRQLARLCEDQLKP